MSRPPIDLDDHAAVLEMFRWTPMRVRHRHVDLVVLYADATRLAYRVAMVDDVPRTLAQHERAQMLGRFWRHLARDYDDLTCAAVGVYRHGHPAADGDDLALHDVIRATATHAGVSCMGVYLCTSVEVVEMSPRAA